MSQHEKQQLVVLFGGRSCEHEVSITSARSMLPHIDRDRFDVTLVGISKAGEWLLIEETSNILSQSELASAAAPRVRVDHANGGQFVSESDGITTPIAVDAVFPVLHGPFGEDGTVQGLLELAGIATVGCGVSSSAVGMDKELSKRVFKAEGLPQVDHLMVRRKRWEERAEAVLLELEGRLGLPVYVKPARMGSSVGVSRADSTDSLQAALTEAAKFDTKMVVEAAAEGFREVECAVLGNDVPEASVVGEIIPNAAFYDYAAKYQSGTSDLVIPANLSEALSNEIRDLSIRAFRAIGATGLARVDFFVNPEDGAILLNEINTMPGFTPISMYPKLWEASGLPYPELINRLVSLALERHAEHQRNAAAL